MIRTRLANARGFTVLEVMVSAGVSAILLAAALPSLSSGVGAHRLQAGLRQTANYVRFARSTAIAKNAQSRIQVSEDGKTVTTQIYQTSTSSWQTTGSVLALSGGTTISAVNPNTGVVFSPQGTVSAASTLTVRNSAGKTGNVTVSILGAVDIAA